MSEPTRKWCNKCGYTGLSAVHENCGYEAIPFEKALVPAMPIPKQEPVGFMHPSEIDVKSQSGRWAAVTADKPSFETYGVDFLPVYLDPQPAQTAPKPAPIEVTDEMLVHLYSHSHDDEWVGHDVGAEALRRIVQRAFKYVGLEVKS